MKDENLEAEIETGISIDLSFLLLQWNKETPTIGARIIDDPRNRKWTFHWSFRGSEALGSEPLFCSSAVIAYVCIRL